MLIRIQTALDRYRIRIHARLCCVWKRFPTGTPSAVPPLRLFQFPTPLTSVRFAPPPPIISLINPLTVPKISLGPQNQVSEGLQKRCSRGHRTPSSRGLLSGTFSPSPPPALPRRLLSILHVATSRICFKDKGTCCSVQNYGVVGYIVVKSFMTISLQEGQLGSIYRIWGESWWRN